MHLRLGSATLSHLAFPGKGNLNFPWEKSHWENTVEKVKVKRTMRSVATDPVTKCRNRHRKSVGVSFCLSLCSGCCLPLSCVMYKVCSEKVTNLSVVRRQNAPPIDVRSFKSVSTPTCLKKKKKNPEHLCLSLMCDQPGQFNV